VHFVLLNFMAVRMTLHFKSTTILLRKANQNANMNKAGYLFFLIANRHDVEMKCRDRQGRQSIRLTQSERKRFIVQITRDRRFLRRRCSEILKLMSHIQRQIFCVPELTFPKINNVI